MTQGNTTEKEKGKKREKNDGGNGRTREEPAKKERTTHVFLAKGASEPATTLSVQAAPPSDVPSVYEIVVARFCAVVYSRRAAPTS